MVTSDSPYDNVLNGALSHGAEKKSDSVIGERIKV